MSEDNDTNDAEPHEEATEAEDLSEIPFPTIIDPEERMYRLFMAPSCRSIASSEHQPTFMYVSAIDDTEAALKAGLVAGLTNGIDCPCQVRWEEADLYV